MNRDYKAEFERRKEKSKRLIADIDKQLAEPFIEKLKKENLYYADWLRENIKKYLKNF